MDIGEKKSEIFAEPVEGPLADPAPAVEPAAPVTEPASAPEPLPA